MPVLWVFLFPAAAVLTLTDSMPDRALDHPSSSCGCLTANMLSSIYAPDLEAILELFRLLQFWNVLSALPL
jgi:hypothetical protein